MNPLVLFPCSSDFYQLSRSPEGLQRDNLTSLTFTESSRLCTSWIINEAMFAEVVRMQIDVMEKD